MTLFRNALIPFLLVVATGGAVAADSEPFPVKGRSITLIVPWGAGGMVDIMGRNFARVWDQKWGTKTIVVNRPGASGQLGLTELLKAKPDGYTIAFAHGFDTQMTYLDAEATAPYSRSSFIPVGLTQRTPETLIVRADSPFRTAQEFLAAVKAEPGKVNLGMPSTRGTPVVYAQILKDKYDAAVTLVPFADAPSTISSLLGGIIDAAISNAAVAYPQFKAGKVRVLMVVGNRALKYYPDAKPSAELGIDLPDLNYTGLALAQGTPAHVVQAWASMLKELSADQELRNLMDGLAVNVDYLTPADYSKLWVETETFAATVLRRASGKVREPK